jgi:hypothetical protein
VILVFGVMILVLVWIAIFGFLGSGFGFRVAVFGSGVLGCGLMVSRFKDQGIGVNWYC